VPWTPTRPFDHGQAATQSISFPKSAISRSPSSLVRIPNDAPVPRASATTNANPAAFHSSASAQLVSNSGPTRAGSCAR
jgi:hypothetical protein